MRAPEAAVNRLGEAPKSSSAQASASVVAGSNFQAGAPVLAFSANIDSDHNWPAAWARSGSWQFAVAKNTRPRAGSTAGDVQTSPQPKSVAGLGSAVSRPGPV